MDSLTKTIGGVTIAGAIIFAPVYPVGPMEFVAAKVQHCDAPDEIPAHVIDTGTSTVFVATTTEHKPLICPKGTDFSVAIFKDSDGNLVYENIPLDRYAQMAKPQGAKDNPTKEELSTLLDALVAPAPAQAAIAFDNSAVYTACVTGTSCTYSFTSTGSNIGMFCNSTSYSTDPGATTMTYNGNSMTQIGSNQTIGGNYEYAFYITNTSAGTFNIVNTTTNSLTNGFYTHCESYTGVGGTDGTPVQGTGSSITAFNCSVTTSVSNSWVVGGVSSWFGRTWSASGSTVKRNGDSQGHVFDLGPVSPGGNALTATVGAADNAGYDCVAFQVFSGSASTPALPVILPQMVGMD